MYNTKQKTLIERVSWESADSKRYELLYGRVPGGYMVSWLKNGGTGGRTLVWSGAFLDWTVVSEKMGVTPDEAAGILSFLKTRQHDIGMPTDFDNYMSELKPPQEITSG
jgi:hypothetical protein